MILTFTSSSSSLRFRFLFTFLLRHSRLILLIARFRPFTSCKSTPGGRSWRCGACLISEVSGFWCTNFLYLQIASIQEQIRQLESVNKDMLDEHSRCVLLIPFSFDIQHYTFALISLHSFQLISIFLVRYTNVRRVLETLSTVTDEPSGPPTSTAVSQTNATNLIH